VTTPPPPGEPTLSPEYATKTTTRIYGTDPFQEAVSVAQHIWTSALPENVPANAANNADRTRAVTLVTPDDPLTDITATPLIHFPDAAPILYVTSKGIPDVTLNELKRLGPHRARTGAVLTAPARASAEREGRGGVIFPLAVPAADHGAGRGRSGAAQIAGRRPAPATLVPVTDDAILTIYEPARAVDVVHRVPVLVVGGGPSGLAAAIAAARAGAEVSLLERFGCFGGNLTVVGVEGLAWYRHEATVEAGGIGREFEERAKAMGAATPDSQSLSYEIDSEGFKVVADRLVEEAGVRPLLHRAFAAPVMNGDAVAGVIVESKAGREAILADRVVDCTGDADVAHRAGAPTRKTPVEKMQAASVMFHRP
jgi:ribulose 1,5-bisphosphate synthetase/thiazole synthase